VVGVRRAASTRRAGTRSARRQMAKHKVSTPVNWQQGDDVIIAGSVSNNEAKELFGSW
jgi:alkyl hydroperoxide reductase subunit AhpC